MSEKNGSWVFLSHSSNDIAKVRLLRDCLEERGHNSLMFHLKSRTDNDETESLIYREIDACDWFVFCNSENAQSSKRVASEREYVRRTKKNRIWTFDLDSMTQADAENKIDLVSRQVSVFVSYTHKDQLLAISMAEALNQAGFSVFSDWNNLPSEPGLDWPRQISDTINEAARCGFTLLLITPATLIGSTLIDSIDEAVHTNRNGGQIIPVFCGMDPSDCPDLPDEIRNMKGITLPEKEVRTNSFERLVNAILQRIPFDRPIEFEEMERRESQTPLDCEPVDSHIEYTSPDQTFISYSRKDEQQEKYCRNELLNNGVSVWQDKTSLRNGNWSDQLRNVILSCNYFVLVLSENSIESENVRWEIKTLLTRIDWKKKVFPIFTGQNFHTVINRLFRYFPEFETNSIQIFDLSDSQTDRRREWNRILPAWNIPSAGAPSFSVGKIDTKVFVLAGCDSVTKYRQGDITGTVENSWYKPRKEVDHAGHEKWLKALENPRTFNGTQVRVRNFSLSEQGHRISLDCQWTRYRSTILTNSSHSRPVYVNGQKTTVGMLLAHETGQIHKSELSNPIAVNMSLITTEPNGRRNIYVSLRGQTVEVNPGGFQPAVSGSANETDVSEGIYDPFRTAIREAQEEATGDYTPKASEITLLGLAHCYRTRYPFFVGIMETPFTQTELMAKSNLCKSIWENYRLIPIDFTVEGVSEWIQKAYNERSDRRLALGSTFFGLLTALMYEYPDRWGEVVHLMNNF